jgi:hypothetical protein
MKSYPAPPIPEATIAAMQQLVAEGATQVELIGAMRNAGLSIIPSIKLLVRFYGLSTTDAKVAVHFSETWADCRESNEALHEAAFEAARQLGFEEVTEPARTGLAVKSVCS